MTTKKIMILAGEASGDLHGARLVEEVRRLSSQVHFFGMGGSEMEKAGVEILVDASAVAVVGLIEVLGHAFQIRQAIKLLTAGMERERPDLLILIDFPDFNLHMARKAKWFDIPVLYYISPQVWAWRQGRVKTIGRLSRRIAVILPFEKKFYKALGVDVDFVGHPLLDTVSVKKSKTEWRRSQGIAPDDLLVGILPGSRKREIQSILPSMLGAARRIKEKINARFILPLAPTISEADLAAGGVNDFDGLITRVRENRFEAMDACNAAMAASGTVTLELAILGTPMAVVYRVSPLTYFVGRLLIDVPHVSLVNLIAGKRVVPELLQQDATAENIAKEILTLLGNKDGNERVLAGLAEVRNLLGGPGASARTAGIVCEMIGAKARYR